MAGEEHTAINGEGLRERKLQQHDHQTSGDAEPSTEPEKSDKTHGRTPDGTGGWHFPSRSLQETVLGQ